MFKKLVVFILVIIASCSITNSVEARMVAESSPENPYRIAVIGDSITYSFSYADVINAAPFVVVENYGIPGSQVAGTEIKESFYNRTTKFKTNADLILIMGGTNDYCAPGLLAKSIGDLDSRDVTTFCGAYNVMINNIRKNNKNARIVLCTPILGKACNGRNIYGFNMENYADATKMIAVNNGLYYIDLFHNENLDFSDDKIADECMKDAIHPNPKGHERIAQEILNGIASIEKMEYLKSLPEIVIPEEMPVVAALPEEEKITTQTVQNNING